MAAKICFICTMSETDDVNYGTWESINDFSVHYFCLVYGIRQEKNSKCN